MGQFHTSFAVINQQRFEFIENVTVLGTNAHHKEVSLAEEWYT